jgi:hypothetical protein
VNITTQIGEVPRGAGVIYSERSARLASRTTSTIPSAASAGRSRVRGARGQMPPRGPLGAEILSLAGYSIIPALLRRWCARPPPPGSGVRPYRSSHDSSPERAGFEPSVPLRWCGGSRPLRSTTFGRFFPKKTDVLFERDRRFESCSLRRRVCLSGVPRDAVGQSRGCGAEGKHLGAVPGSTRARL